MALAVETRSTPYTKRWAALAVILGAEAMDQLDASIVAVSVPTIRDDLGVSLPVMQWIVAGYSLAMAVGLITGGRLGDIVGRRRMFLAGVLGFLLTSLLCALAPSGEVLIASRILQGLCGALMLPQGFGMIKEMFPAQEMVKALAMFGPVMGLSSVGGPIVAGVLIDLDLFGLGWRSSFLLNLPVGLLTLVAGIRLLPHRRQARAAPVRLDLPGVLLAGSGSLLLIFGLVQGGELGWPSWTFLALAAGIAVFGVFALRIRRVRFPLVEPSLFGKRAYTGGVLIAIMFSGLVASLALILNLLTQLQLGYSPTEAGVAMAPVSVGVVIGAVGGFGLARRIGRRTLQLGLIVTGVGLLTLLALLPEAGGSPWYLVPGVFIAGLGMGLMIAPLFSFILAGVDDHEVGSASGVLTASQQLGSALGVATLGTLFTATSFSATLLAMGAALVLTFALVFLLPRHGRAETA
ncbi:MFS transporter [Ruania zhangjianzhongii]|uniref:MFS transporter n=1 Tax=Ruania zhangjianzhongii TaxID=2603206 RepID=UPI0011CCD7D0|nr:MFS transporter [Ruania zhangjianzhongii]